MCFTRLRTTDGLREHPAVSSRGDGNPEFEELTEQAIEAIAEDELTSVYAGLVHEDGQQEYYFGNDIEETDELRETAAAQLGMMLRVLADRSDSTVDESSNLPSNGRRKCNCGDAQPNRHVQDTPG